MVNNQRVKGMRCLDSTWVVSTICPLGQQRLNIVLFYSFYDKIKKTIRLIGRVQTLASVNSTGLTGIEIYKAVLNESKLINRTKIGETTDGKDFIENDGFFDITTQIGLNESIFFYRKTYYLEEFRVWRL